jgi:hypothetical protein
VRKRREPERPRRPRVAGSISLEPPQDDDLPQEPPAPPPAEPAGHAEPRSFDLIARFTTAAGALTFAEQAMQAAQRHTADCYRAEDGSWWVSARAPLGAAREMAGLGAGRLYVRDADLYTADRGWGDEPPPGPARPLPAIAPVSLLDLVRVADLHRVPIRPLREACVLAPGYLVRLVLERALDLGLHATFQPARLDPLFAAATGFPGEYQGNAVARACYAVWLSTVPGQAGGVPVDAKQPAVGQPGAVPEPLPARLLGVLADNPFLLVCRTVGRTLLVGYGTASPLSDQALVRLVTAAADGTWLLAASPDGCARVSWSGEPLDAAALVELGPAHALIDLDGSQPYAEPGAARGPVPSPLTLARAAAPRARIDVDAVLLDDADLDTLPLLLTGEPLADIAILVCGRDRHLLTAPGGLLTELGVGEPLTCVGPGSVYVPTGYRLDPPIGLAARAALFQPDRLIAQVMLADARLGFDLDAAKPVWALWAGPAPEFDPQLPRSALDDLELAAREIGEPPQATGRPRSLIDRLRGRSPQPVPDPSDWRRQAWEAELNRDYVTAAQLYAGNKEPRRAARMWERDAEERTDR